MTIGQTVMSGLLSHTVRWCDCIDNRAILGRDGLKSSLRTKDTIPEVEVIGSTEKLKFVATWFFYWLGWWTSTNDTRDESYGETVSDSKSPVRTSVIKGSTWVHSCCLPSKDSTREPKTVSDGRMQKYSSNRMTWGIVHPMRWYDYAVAA